MSAFFFASIVSVAALLISGVAAYLARAAIRASESRLAVPRSLDSRTQSLEQSVAELQSTLEELANRVKMMKVRNAVRHVPDRDAEPDPYRDPNGWRERMNKRLMFGHSTPNLNR